MVGSGSVPTPKARRASCTAGLLATFADEVMGFVQHGGNAVRLTAEMTLRYRRPTPVDTELVCRAQAGETRPVVASTCTP